MLNPVWINMYPGQKKPRILRQLDMFHFNGIEICTDMPKRQLERASDRFLRCLSHAASQQSIGNLDKTPSARLNLLFQPAGISWPHEVPALAKFFRRQFEANGQLNPDA